MVRRRGSTIYRSIAMAGLFSARPAPSSVAWSPWSFVWEKDHEKLASYESLVGRLLLGVCLLKQFLSFICGCSAESVRQVEVFVVWYLYVWRSVSVVHWAVSFFFSAKGVGYLIEFASVVVGSLLPSHFAIPAV